MKAIVYDDFGADPTYRSVPSPEPAPHGVVLRVDATGLCRSDWHGWQGHDAMIEPPHVPGHEVAGTIVERGPNVAEWAQGDRVTVPFVGGCGHCAQCRAGQPQVCPNQFQPGFSGWGTFAERVAIDYADANLVALPSEHINNIFKLTGKMGKKINSETTIPLKDFSGLFKKLSGNMKGALRGISEKELKKITAEVRSIGAGIENPKNVILCTCDHGQVLLPVTAPHSGNLFLVTEMQHEPNNYSEYTVQIDSLGNIPVYIPS